MLHEDLSTSRKAVEAELYRRVVQSMVEARRPAILNVSVTVVNRAVTLRGTVPGRFDHDIALAAVRNVPGVREVIDHIKVASS